MELKVWVDGVVRVVCGLSEETSCQDVVITLAQAMGQTGRYVLIQRLRDNDRQLLANEKLLESMTKLGQKASDIQFFLRRIGPSNQDIAVLDKGIVCTKQLPKDSFSSLTKKKTSVSTPLPGSSAGVSKDELFQQVLQQQTRLHALEVQLEALDREVLVWEQMTAPSYQPLEEKLEAKLEKMLYAENDQELESNCKLRELHRVLDSYDNRLRDLTAHSERLQQEMQLENIRQQPVVAQSSLEESLGSVEVQLESQWKHGEELESSLSEIEEALGGAEALLQAKTEQLDKLNKELRRCNLQQFIQQTGTHMHADLEHLEKTERMHRLPNGCCNGPGSCHTELPARSTARQFLGHPRNLLNPRISSLNPEGVFV